MLQEAPISTSFSKLPDFKALIALMKYVSMKHEATNIQLQTTKGFHQHQYENMTNKGQVPC